MIMDKTEGWKENVWWISWSVFTLLQVILVFFLYNPDGLKALFYLGWIILTFGFLIGSMGVSTLKKMGGVPKEKTSSRFGVGTTTMVDSGVYSIVRHPQYLCWMFFSLAIILITQHWLILIIGIAAMVTIYLQARQDEESFIERFGDQYKGGSTRFARIRGENASSRPAISSTRVSLFAGS